MIVLVKGLQKKLQQAIYHWEHSTYKQCSIHENTSYRIYETGFESQHARSYRVKLKQRILLEYGNELLFLTTDSKSPQVIVSAKGLDTATVVKDNKETIGRMCKILTLWYNGTC